MTHQATGVAKRLEPFGKVGKCGAEQSLQSAGDLEIGREHRQHERENEGGDREIEPADPQRHRADREPDEACEQEHDQKDEEDVPAEIVDDDRREIGADGEEASLAQRVEAEHAGDEIKADGEDAEHRRDQHEALDAEVRVRDERGRREVGGDKQSDADVPEPRLESRADQSGSGARGASMRSVSTRRLRPAPTQRRARASGTDFPR